jgi:hypothetical protein
MGANQSQIKTPSQSCLNGNLENTPVFITESSNNDGSESTTISLSNFDGCSYNRIISIDKSVNSKNLEYSVFYSNENGSNITKKLYDLEENFTNAEQAESEKTLGAPVTSDFPFVKESVLEYNNNKIYTLGTVVKYKNELYKFKIRSRSSGYNPIKYPNYWTKVISVTNLVEPTKPKILPISPLPEPKPASPISPDIILNVGGPSWGQYVIKPNLVQSSIVLGSSIMAGFTRIVIADQAVNYSDNTMYRLGDVINFNNNNYINLSYNDYRGPSFSGSIKVSPDKDKNVWKQVKLVLPPPIPGKINVTSASYGLNCNPNLKDNRSTLFRNLTRNKLTFEYNYDYKKTGGDPASGCDKELEILYNCDNGTPDKRIFRHGEAGNGALVKFNCIPPPPITNKTFRFNDLKSGILVAWFDANDTNADGSKNANGTQINIWKDKTSNNNDAVKGNWGKPPVVISNGLNELSVLDLQGTSELSFSLNSLVTTYTIFSVQFGKGPYTDFQRLLHGQSGDDNKLLYGLHSNNGTWMTGFGNDKWTDLNKNIPEEGTNNKWTFADVVVNVTQNTALPSFNGTNQNKKSMLLSGFDSMTIGCKNGGGQPWRGLVAELLVFSGTINDDERKLIQGYLAWKWGLQDNLPDEHSYKYVNTKVLPDPIPKITDKTFTFSSIKSANLIGWYDANDIYGNGSNVSDGSEIKTWTDKSTSSNDAISTKSTNNPSILANKINNLSVLDLKGSTILNVSFGYKLEKYSIFSVQFSKGPYGDWQRLINGQSDGDSKLLYGLRNNSDIWMTGLGNTNWTDLDINKPAQSTNDKWYLTDVTVDTTNNTTISYFNGYVQNTKKALVNGFDSLTIGSINGNQPWKGLVGEILVFDGIISDDERQKVQSYLANKWDLQKKLSIYHPYKYINMKVLPNPVQEITNQTFKFSDIKSGELLAWFDGNDPRGDGSVVTNGTPISTWSDKSINSNDAIKGNWGNPPIVLADNLNKLSVIDLQGTTQLSFPLGSKLTKYTIFSVQFSKGPYGDWQRLLHGQSGADGRLLYGLTAGTNKWITGFGNGNWANLSSNTPEKNTDGMWTFTDVVVDVPQSSALPSFNGTMQNKKIMALDGFDSITIGCQNGGVQPWRGYVAEILVFNGLISDSDRQIIQSYLATKWGLKKNLLISHPYKYINMKLLYTKNVKFVKSTILCRQTPYVSMTKDGKYIAVTINSINIYLSKDYGVTWKSLRDGLAYPFNNYTSVFISNDAKVMVYNGWQSLFYSTDQGTTWTRSTPNDAYSNLIISYPSNIVGSDDGSVLYGGGYRICKSVDGGKNWSVISEIGLNEGDLCMNFACSGDGSFVIFTRRGGDGSGRPFLSRDFGQTWIATTLPKLYTQRIFCSKDGKNIAVSAYDNGANPTIYVSTDNGNTWTAKKTLQPKFKCASGFGMSGDGSTMIFGGQNWWGGPRDVVISKDLGDTWNKVTAPLYNWEYFACSYDGSMIVGAPYSRDQTNDYISIYNTPNESFTNILAENKNCILPNKKYIDGILDEQINSDGSIVTTISIPPFDKCNSGKIITINVSSDMNKLILRNSFTSVNGDNVIETYYYTTYKNNTNYYNRYITQIGIFIMVCLFILYIYKKRKNLLITN